MNLSKAIEILTESSKERYSRFDDDETDAIKLLIKAGKAVEIDRNLGMPWHINLLPGETPENYHPNTATILKRLKESPLGQKPEA